MLIDAQMLSVIMDIARYSAQNPGWKSCHVSNVLAKPNHRSRRLFTVKVAHREHIFLLWDIRQKQDNLYSWVVFYPFKARQLVLTGCIVPILGHCSQKKSKNLLGLAMKLLPLWLLLPQVQAWWCDTSERTGCRGQPRQFRKEIGQLDPISRFQESLSRMGQVFSRQTIQTCFGTWLSRRKPCSRQISEQAPKYGHLMCMYWI